MSKQVLTINDRELDDIIKEHIDEKFAWDPTKILIDGRLYYRESIANTGVSTKMTAASIIKKEPEFDYHFMDEVYSILDEHKVPQIFYAHVTKKISNKDEGDYQNELDLYSAFPHILKYERMPLDGTLYKEESPDRMNFYLYKGKKLRPDCIITDDLKSYIEEHNMGSCEFLFSLDCKVGSKMGDRLIPMVYKNKKTKAEAKQLHYGYYQKKFLQYDRLQDCYIRNPKYSHELLMVAIESQLVYIMLNIVECIGGDGFIKKDAYHFDVDPDLDAIRKLFDEKFSNYDYRVIDNWKKRQDNGDDDGIVYKSYPELAEAPRSHHKKA